MRVMFLFSVNVYVFISMVLILWLKLLKLSKWGFYLVFNAYAYIPMALFYG